MIHVHNRHELCKLSLNCCPSPTGNQKSCAIKPTSFEEHLWVDMEPSIFVQMYPPLINSITSPCINFSAHCSQSIKIYLIHLFIWQGSNSFTHQGRQGTSLVLQLFGQGLQEPHTEASEDRSRKSSLYFIFW